MKTIDFNVRNCFSLIMLYPNSRRADLWVKENVFLENWQNSGGIAIEPRFFGDIYEAIKHTGLTIQGSN